MPTIKVRDVRIHYHVYGEGEPLLMIAGLCGDLYNWKKALPHLEKSHRVIVFDNRGSGHTEAPDAPFSMADMGDDAAGLLDALGVAKAHVLGWSMGGNVAQEVVLRHPEKVGALVLMSTYIKEPDRSRFAIDAMIHSVREGASMETFLMMMQAWCSTDPSFRGKSASWSEQDRSDCHQALEGFARQKKALDAFDSRKLLHMISAPTLVVHGTDDIMVHPTTGRSFRWASPALSCTGSKARGTSCPRRDGPGRCSSSCPSIPWRIGPRPRPR
jgi:pimeloyl-ACP methyl ester carboxylesterase